MPKLNEVYGISTSVPKYTYVDRVGLDSRFKYLLDSDRHIVIYGGSKQGKTVLRRRFISDAESIVVPCKPDHKAEDVYRIILSELRVTVPTTRTRTGSSTGEVSGEAGAQAQIALFGNINTKLASKTTGQKQTADAVKSAVDETSIPFIAESIRSSRRRLVFEDFHYLPEVERRRLAFDFKALWDLKVFALVIGLWVQQNLLSTYNSDIAGRVEELDVHWNEGELEKVISAGESALNIHFGPDIKLDVIHDANKNVGLLQRLLEAICLEAGIYETSLTTINLTDSGLLESSRRAICRNIQERYHVFANLVGRGYKNPGKTKLKLYRQIVRVCIEASDDELTAGFSRDMILERVQALEPKADLQNLQKALQRLNKLQADRKIDPLVLSYNDITKTVTLADRELLFYRKYSTAPWPWQSGYAEPEECDDDDDDDVVVDED